MLTYDRMIAQSIANGRLATGTKLFSAGESGAAHDDRRPSGNGARLRAHRTPFRLNTIVPPCERFTSRRDRRTRLKRFSIRLVDDSTRARHSGRSRCIIVSVSSSPSRKEAAALEWAGFNWRAGFSRRYGRLCHSHQVTLTKRVTHSSSP